jgi:hypothetical protein
MVVNRRPSEEGVDIFAAPRLFFVNLVRETVEMVVVGISPSSEWGSSHDLCKVS